MKQKSFDQARHSGVNYRAVKPLLQLATENGGHIRLESGSFEPLAVENLEYTDHKGRPVWGMMQFYTQNGDLMRDPDYTFSVDETGGYIVPLSWQLDALGLYREVFQRNSAGQLMYSRRLLVDCDEGMWEWLKALHEQGFPVEKG